MLGISTDVCSGIHYLVVSPGDQAGEIASPFVPLDNERTRRSVAPPLIGANRSPGYRMRISGTGERRFSVSAKNFREEPRFMVKAQQGKWVVPNPQIPRSFGLMNIIFGSLLLLIALGHGFWYLYTPTFARQMQDRMKQVEVKAKAEHDEKIADLKKEIAAAKTKEEKESLQDERAALEKNVVTAAPFGDLTGMNVMSDRRIAAYYALEVSAAVILNVLMIVSGAGLLGLTEWARRMAIVVAQLKILRWFAMTVLMMVLVLPVTMEFTEKAMAAAEAQIKAQGQGAAMPVPMSEFIRFGMIFAAVWQVFSAIVASVYPALMWWYLSRPPARAACMKQPEPEQQEPELEWGTTV
jgi:energy-coupling factor transporter transmembrane protein EcfT